MILKSSFSFLIQHVFCQYFVQISQTLIRNY